METSDGMNLSSCISNVRCHMIRKKDKYKVYTCIEMREPREVLILPL